VFHNDTAALVFGPTERRTAEAFVPELSALKAVAGGGAPQVRSSVISTQRNGVMQTSASQSSLVTHLERFYGFHQATALDKDVPERIHSVPEDLKVAYLQGLFSADGCIRFDARAAEPE